MTLKYSSIFGFNLLLVNKWSDFIFFFLKRGLKSVVSNKQLAFTDPTSPTSGKKKELHRKLKLRSEKS